MRRSALKPLFSFSAPPGVLFCACYEDIIAPLASEALAFASAAFVATPGAHYQARRRPGKY